MIFIADRYGFVSRFYWGTDRWGNPQYKAEHCVDVREALPFVNRYEAEAEYKKTYMSSWWHCCLSTDNEKRLCPEGSQHEQSY